MNARLFAMDTSFHTSLGCYDFDARCEITAELGYDGTYLTYSLRDAVRQDLEKLTTVRSRFGIEVAGLWLAVDLSRDANPRESVAVAEDVLNRIEGATRIELCLRYRDGSVAVSDPAGDDHAARVLDGLLGVAEKRGLDLLLYPHCNDWLEKFADALRLCGKVDHPRLGCVFCGFHWYFRDEVDLRRLHDQLQQAGPRLRSVNLNGSSKPGGPGSRPTIEPLDRGDLDNFALLTLLHDAGYAGYAGYAGWIGVQGYSVGGDVYAHLRRSHDALRDMLDRVGRQPAWGRMRPPG
jgi:sugar phosphate isomerase/epimerase